MKISYNWLQKYFKEKLPESQIIADGIIFHAFEIEEVEEVGNDTIFDIKILPDRAHDCLSHFGIAKEISVIFDIKLNNKEKENQKVSAGDGGLTISVLDNKCRRYMGRIVKGVKIGPSPDWLVDALEHIGQKSINNIVDATNYVMFDLGNPIHVFDLDKLASPKIIVEPAKNNEKFTLLDGKEVVLDESMLTIRDEKEALVIAGVKGGKKAEIDNNTTNIVIEVANFDPVSVRKTAKKLNIFTESAKRFENEISTTLAPIAMDEITNFILELAGGEAYEVVDINNSKEETRSIIFTETYLNNLLGVIISNNEIKNILERFGYEYKNEGDSYEIKIPSLRLDMSGPHDMAEEIGRAYGYEKIIPVLPEVNFKSKDNLNWVKICVTKQKLIEDGYTEVMTYVFRDKGDLEVLASASNKNFLRTNITDGLKESIKLNILNLPLLDMKEVKVFEIGTVFGKDKEEMHVAYGDKKNIVEVNLEEFVKNIPMENIEKLISHSIPASPFKMWSIYPFIARDIAVWVPEGEDKDKLKNILIKEGTSLLIKEPYLFDSFNKEGRTSFAYRLVFQSYDRTLTDEEVNPIMNNVTKKISSLGWEVR